MYDYVYRQPQNSMKATDSSPRINLSLRNEWILQNPVVLLARADTKGREQRRLLGALLGAVERKNSNG
jgi:hypothetical protein